MKASIERIAFLTLALAVSLVNVALLSLLGVNGDALVISGAAFAFASVVVFALCRSAALGDEMLAAVEAEWVGARCGMTFRDVADQPSRASRVGVLKVVGDRADTRTSEGRK